MQIWFSKLFGSHETSQRDVTEDAAAQASTELSDAIVTIISWLEIEKTMLLPGIVLQSPPAQIK